MPKLAKELTALQVKHLIRPGWHAVGGVAGLLLQVRAPTGKGGLPSRSWILRNRSAGKRRPLGLGAYPAAYGMPVCRFHGARHPKTIKRGADHPLYRHGRETLEARRNRVEAMTRIRVLTDLGVAGGFLTKRISGRRPNTKQQVTGE